MENLWTYRYIALYNTENKLISMILYKENVDVEIYSTIDIYAEKNMIKELIYNVRNGLLPFEPISSMYFKESIEKTYATFVTKGLMIEGEFKTNIENLTMAKKQVIKQENKALIRKRVKIYDE